MLLLQPKRALLIQILWLIFILTVMFLYIHRQKQGVDQRGFI